ncbi:MAG: hypothetical protein LUF30_07360, partial [Lachnospiraceae bacterium]|nr:hypothetical protein [Lachnospiraceae bacterium]
MKRRIVLLLAAMMLAAVPGSAVFANEVSDAIIAEDEAEPVLEDSAETEAALDETDVSLEEADAVLLEEVEEVNEEEPVAVSEDEPAAIASSGTCGDNVTWTLSSKG